MELQQLKYFQVVAKYESMSKAAEILNIAQPAVSQSIKRLEKELGVELFDSEGRKIILNEKGKWLSKKVPKMLEPIENLPDEIGEVSLKPKTKITMLIKSSSVLIPEMLKEFMTINDNVRFHVYQNESVHQNYDICITSVPLSQEVTDGIILLKEKLLLAIPVESELARKQEITIFDLAEQTFVALEKGKPYTNIAMHYFHQYDFYPTIEFEADSPGMVRGFIEAGLGIAFYPEYTWGVLASNQTVLREISGITCGRQIILFAKSQNPVVDQLIKFIVDYYNIVKNR
jgi:DNA-binding transcriptional LysR family regulator